MSSNTNIGNTPVNQGYVQLIHTGETGGIDGTLRTLYDGDGTASDLQIASNKVKVSTELYIGSDTLQEYIQDTVGAMLVTNASHTNLSAAYDDAGDGAIDLTASGEVTLTGTQTLTNKTLASPTFTGTANGVNLTLSGDLTVNGTTTTLDTTNLKVTDNLIELNQGVSSNANDSGIIIERGSTGDNAIFMWDESADKFTLGTTTATADATGNITITTGTLVASTFEGNLTGNVTGSASLNLLISNNLSDLANAATARTNLGVDAAGTDNSTDVTLAGTLDYLTLSGQQITRNAIDLTTDVTGTLPVGNGGTGLTSISTLLNSNVTPTSLGLVIGTDVQAQDTLLQDIADFSLSNPSQDGYLIAYSDTEPQLELVAPGISFNGSTANGLLTYGNSTTADVESSLTFNGSVLELKATSAGRSIEVGSGATGDITSFVDLIGDTTYSDYGARFIRFGGANATTDFRHRGTGDFRLIAQDSAAISLQTGSTERLRISSAGDVDIKATKKLYLDGGGNTYIFEESADNVIHYVGGQNKLRFNSTGTILNDAGLALDFRVEGDTDPNLFFVDGSADRVGIGTNSPSAKLDVVGSGNTGIEVTGGSGYLAGYFATDFDYVAKFVSSDASSAIVIEDSNSTSNYNRIGVVTNDMFFVTNNSEAMRIDSSGNVGIGITNPSSRLHISENGGSTDDAFVVNPTNGGNRTMTIDGEKINVTYTNSGGAGPALVLQDNGGNVGIGTTSPRLPLHIASPDGDDDPADSSATGALLVTNSAASYGIEMGVSSSGDGWIQSHSVINSNEYNLNLNPIGGNVGIGTSSPSYKLDVSGDYRFKDTASGGALLGYHHNDSNNGLLLLVYGSAYSSGSVLSVGANGTAYHHSHTVGINAGSGSDIKFGAGGTEKFRMESDGDFHATQDVVAFSTTPSDKKLKTNVKDIDYGLDTIMKLNPKQYDWKKDNRKDIGFIAQEVEEVIPEIVKDKEWFDDKIKTLDYEKLTAVLIKAVQEQQEQINKLRKNLNG